MRDRRVGGKDHALDKKALWAVALGNCLELYDFTLFSYFSVLLAKLFFPTHDPLTSLLLTVSTFGIGFVARPIGGILFGALADRIDRGRVMVMTMALMAAGTGIVAVCPGYREIGVWAPAILVVGRLVQGLGIGGEVGPTASYLFETGRDRSRVFHVSIFMASQGFSALLGGATGLLLGIAFTPEHIEAGAWRLPFLAGLLLGPVGVYLRARLRGHFSTAVSAKIPLRRMLGQYKAQIVSGFLLFLSGTASTYVVMFYMPTYLTGVVGLPARTAFLAAMSAGLVMAPVSLLGGILADRYAAQRLLILISVTGSSFLILPAFHLLEHQPPLSVTLGVVAVLVALNALQAGSVLALILGSFSADVRATGTAVVYSAGVVVGGLAPMIVTTMIKLTGDLASPGLYMIACGSCSALALAFGRFSPGAPPVSEFPPCAGNPARDGAAGAC